MPRRAMPALSPASLPARSGSPPTAPSPPTRTRRTSCWSSRSCRSASRPRATTLAEAAERERLMRVFDRGLGKPVGYVLPLLATHDAAGKRRFVTERWAFRRGHLFLLPGSLPAGLRLPLARPARDRLRGLSRTSSRPIPSPTGVRCPQPAREPAAAPPAPRPLPPPARTRPQPGAHGAGRRAARRAHLCVFLPPLADAADYAAPDRRHRGHRRQDAPARPPRGLRAALRSAPARHQGHARSRRHRGQRAPRRLLGCTPSTSPRPSTRKPPPSASAPRSSCSTAATSAPAAATTSSLGGITPADSPFLRRPDLLASVIAYWQNHPSLSYLFAGLFVGPTSQAPRVDEARHESLYELEIALAQVPAARRRHRALAGRPPVPQPARRRHRQHPPRRDLHRQALRAGRSHGPPRPRRVPRLRDAAARAHEPRPAAARARARRLVLGAALPPPAGALGHRAARPLHAAALLVGRLRERHRRPCAMRASRCRRDGSRPTSSSASPCWAPSSTRASGSSCARRSSPGSCSASRADPAPPRAPSNSSLERDRGARRRRPRRPLRRDVQRPSSAARRTGSGGAAVAGVRFRAWPSPEGFHPNIPPHVPLTFDVIDTWNGRSVGGCRYHVAHPGGRIFQALPVNALEAESRRLARFESIGHSPGASPLRPGGDPPGFPAHSRPAPRRPRGMSGLTWPARAHCGAATPVDG